MAIKRRSKKVIITGIAAVVVIAAVVILNSGSGKEPTSIQADLAYIDDISEIVSASGRIQPQTKVDITSEVSAQIISIFVKEGEFVERGQRLILLDTIQLQSDVSQARYSMDEISSRAEAAKAQLEIDKLESERQSKLYEQKLTSENAATNAGYMYENSRANYQAMLAQVETARARLDKANDNLTKTLIKAPMAGVVTFLSVEAGEIAQAQTAFTQGKTLMTIADLSVFEVEIDVDESEIAKILMGQKAQIKVDAFRDTSFEGTVVEIGNSATVANAGSDNYTTSFRVKVRFDMAEVTFRPGMSATVDITTNNAEDALLVPYAALVTREFDPDALTAKAEKSESGGIIQQANAAESAASDNGTKRKKSAKIKKSGIFVVRDGKAKFIEITTGIADERNIVALTGVAPGDTIISGSYQTLRKIAEGDVITIEQASIDKMKEK
ncbi:MAG: efflux RND transporter periplasmic adaptor subunit [Candidatus Zixiibacteriota bacterium]